MTDNAERKVRQWAQNRNGDPLTPRDVVDLVFAFADDLDADLEQRDAEFNSLCDRTDVLEKWRTESALTCVDRVTAIAEKVAHDQHAPMHKEHMKEFHDRKRATDAEGSNHHEQRRDSQEQKTLSELFLGYGIVKWAVTIAVGALIIFAINYAGSYYTVVRGQQQLQENILRQTQESRDQLKADILEEETNEREQLRQEVIDAIKATQ